MQGHYVHQNEPQVVTAMGGFEVTQLACGAHHTLFMTAGDGAFACGWDQYGQLGAGRDPTAAARVAQSDVGSEGMDCTPRLLKISRVDVKHEHTPEEGDDETEEEKALEMDEAEALAAAEAAFIADSCCV